MRIHLLGIGGTGMGALAGLLIEAGHTVTGTDGPIYPPMSDQLGALGIMPFVGYAAENIETARPDMVVIGNVIRRDNPEAQEAMRRNLPYRSMADMLAELFLEHRMPLIITGTHGKTTCSTLAAWLLDAADLAPGFFIGGVGRNFDRSYAQGRGPFFVVEGDEYDTAFFDKTPKFLHYRPQAILITSIEFDHADIYNDLDAIIDAFARLIAIMPPDGLIVANAEDETVMRLVHSAPCRVVRYGREARDAYHPSEVSADSEGTRFTLLPPRAAPEKTTPFLLPMWGEHNLMNATGVLALLLESGVEPDALVRGLAAFEGVRRRQEIVSQQKGVTIVDDFAHHPTAVGKTIEAMRLRFPGARIWAIFEPRSNTSRRNIFQKEYERALGLADRVVMASPFHADELDSAERFDADAIAETLMHRGIDAHHIPDADHITEFVMRSVDAGDVILVMSNGGFDGLLQKLTEALKTRRIVADHDAIAPGRIPKR